MKTKKIDVKVKKIKWMTDPRGFQQPILLLTKKLPNGFDSLAVPLREVLNMGIGIGTVLYLESTGEDVFDIKRVVRNANVTLPTECNSCGAVIHSDKCSNHTCSAIPRAGIVRVITESNPYIHPDTVNAYLDNFPISFERTISIKDTAEFVYNIKRIGGLGTTGRSAIMQKHLAGPLKETGDSWQRFVDLEIHFEHALSINAEAHLNCNRQQFWMLINLPKLSEEDNAKLLCTDPTTLNFHDLPLSKDGNQIILENAQHIFSILDMMKK